VAVAVAAAGAAGAAAAAVAADGGEEDLEGELEGGGKLPAAVPYTCATKGCGTLDDKEVPGLVDGLDKLLATAPAKVLRKVALVAEDEDEDEDENAELAPLLPPPLIATIFPVPWAKRLAVGSCCIPI
jgi:hypothetical protein